MEHSVPIQMKQRSAKLTPKPGGFLLPLAILMLLLAGLYVYLTSQNSQQLPLVAHLEQSIGIDAPADLYEDAIAYAAKNLAIELDIDLENYDLSMEDYQAIVETATQKFNNCQQYRLISLGPRSFSCYTCVSRPKVILHFGQTFKIGQTCGDQKSRYGSELPEPGLKYFEEFGGNIFEVLVAEYVKLVLFKVSTERKEIIKNNQLSETEMQLPPGNKILK